MQSFLIIFGLDDVWRNCVPKELRGCEINRRNLEKQINLELRKRKAYNRKLATHNNTPTERAKPSN
jgi:hypothetical protein